MIELTFLKELVLIKQVHQECDVCHYCYFLNYSFKFQPNACNRCHDLLMMSIKLSDIAIKLLILIRYQGKTNFEVQRNFNVTLQW